MQSDWVKIRPANIHDSAELARLLGHLGYPVTEEFVRGRIDLIRRTGLTEIFVADTGESLAGFLSFEVSPLFHQDGNIGCITALSVDPALKGRGIGRQLVDAGEAFASDHHCIKISVASGMHRTEAHDFYRSLGYEEITKRFVKQIVV